MRSLRRKLGYGIDVAFGLAVLAAVVALAVGALVFGRGAVRVVEGWVDGHAQETDAVHLRGHAAAIWQRPDGA
jgi:hypothetical protein